MLSSYALSGTDWCLGCKSRFGACPLRCSRLNARLSLTCFALHTADIFNEPHGGTWSTGDLATDWDVAATAIGDAVLAECPRWLVFVEARHACLCTIHLGLSEKSPARSVYR
eukprot:4502366-Pleurochrysis_carterae.AAC.4